MLKSQKENSSISIYKMEQEKILDELESLLANLAIELRYEKGDFVGGFYRYKDRQQIVINKDLTINQKIRIIAQELRSNSELESVFLVPALREVIENASSVE